MLGYPRSVSDPTVDLADGFLLSLDGSDSLQIFFSDVSIDPADPDNITDPTTLDLEVYLFTFYLSCIL